MKGSRGFRRRGLSLRGGLLALFLALALPLGAVMPTAALGATSYDRALDKLTKTVEGAPRLYVREAEQPLRAQSEDYDFAAIMAEWRAKDLSDIEAALVAGAEAFQEEIDLSAFDIPADAFHNEVWHRFFNDHPELFWMDKNYRIDEYGMTPVDTVRVAYYIDKDEIPAMREKYEAAIDDALAWIPEGATTEEKAKALHDYVAWKCSYDYALERDVKAGGYSWEEYDAFWATHPFSHYTSYGALVEGSGICEAYSLAFNELAKRAGVTSIYASGWQSNHAWNHVKLSDKWYLVDITWDDAGDPKVPSTQYFMKSRNYLNSIGDQAHNGFSSWSLVIDMLANSDSTIYDQAEWPSYVGGRPSGIDLSKRTLIVNDKGATYGHDAAGELSVIDEPEVHLFQDRGLYSFETLLESGKDYEATYEDLAVQADGSASATMVIVGIGDYTGLVRQPITLSRKGEPGPEPGPAAHTLCIMRDGEGVTALLVNGVAQRFDYVTELAEGETVDLAVNLADGYAFDYWKVVAGEENGCKLVPGNGINGEARLTMGAGDVELVVSAKKGEPGPEPGPGPEPWPAADCHFDINFLLDGEFNPDQGALWDPFGESQVYGTFDLSIVDPYGRTVIERAGIDDFVGSVPVGSTWTITNLRTRDGIRFDAEGSGPLSGTIAKDEHWHELVLKFDSVPDPEAKHTVRLVAVDGIDHFIVGGASVESVELALGERVQIAAVRKDGYRATEWMFGDWTNGGASFEDAYVDTVGIDAINFTMGSRDVTLLAYAYVPTCHFDINFLIDGQMAWDQSDDVYGTFDLSIVGPDGAPIYDEHDIDDFFGGVPLGSTWAISNVRAKDGYHFDGAAQGDLTGVISEADESLEVVLAFSQDGTQPVPDPQAHTLTLDRGVGVDAVLVNGAEAESVELQAGDEVELSVRLAPSYAFDTWKLVVGDGSCELIYPEVLDARGIAVPATFVMGTGDAVVSAQATRTYSLEVVPSEGIATAGASRQLFPYGWSQPETSLRGLYPGDRVELTASVKAGYQFVGWTLTPEDGDARIEQDPDGSAWLTVGTSDIVVTAASRRPVVYRRTATFTRGSYVESLMVGGKTYTGTAKVTLAEGESVELVATPKAGKVITGWKAATTASANSGWTVEAVEGRENTWRLTAGTANARFSPLGRVTAHTLKLTRGTGVASVAIAGAGSASVVLNEGESAALDVVLKPNYVFKGWEVVKGGDTNFGWLHVDYNLAPGGTAPDTPDCFVMGEGNVTLRAVAAKIPGGKLAATKSSGIASVALADGQASIAFVRAGERVPLVAEVKDGYVFAGWVVTKGDATIDDPSSLTTAITMGSSASTVKAMVKARHTLRLSKGSGVSSFRINGVSRSSLAVSEGASVEVTVVMKKGYTLADLTATLGTGYELSSVPGQENTFTFVMGQGNVTLKATGTKAATGVLRSAAGVRVVK